MDHLEAGRYWEGNAEAWSALARKGYDFYRDRFNAPAFAEMLPDVAGLSGLDIGCGEGYNTRLAARRGAKLTAIDISPTFIEKAGSAEREEPLGIDYLVASAVALPFADAAFDFAMATMSLMDIPETEAVLREAFRVIRPGGFLQFSITHPCFDTPHRKNLRDETGRTYAIEVGDYFSGTEGRVNEWTFTALPPEERKKFRPFQVPFFHRTLADWLNLVLECGFRLERFSEPLPDERTVSDVPNLQDARVVAYFLHIRAVKPA